jgi:transcriptional regulator with PAS, ATPase and Fis domain
MQRIYAAIADAARDSRTLLVVGPTGAGKELAARHFHRAGPRPQGPFVAVNCATIPAGLAERVLFGAVRGAYSGADSNADGYVHAADGGVLFLDELGELELTVQAKLLRFLETREVYAVGATRPRTVDVRVCSATHRDLRAMAGRREFREDLYFRLGRPQVALPAAPPPPRGGPLAARRGPPRRRRRPVRARPVRRELPPPPLAGQRPRAPPRHPRGRHRRHAPTAAPPSSLH